MKKKTVLLVIVLALVLLIAGASVLYRNLGDAWMPEQLPVPETQIAEEDGTEPPKIAALDFLVYDKEGNEVKLSDFYGKPIVLNFWASWCGPCKMEMPDFDEQYQNLEGEVQFLMVNMTDGSQETVESASEFIEEQGYAFPVFYDTDGIAAYVYQVYSLPTTYFVDAEGYLVTRFMGAMSADILQRGIDLIYTQP